MEKLIRNYPEYDEALFKAIEILSEARFDFHFENGQLRVYHRAGDIEVDYVEGLVIVDDDYREDYEDRQEELYEL
jgi:hypothetical protein